MRENRRKNNLRIVSIDPRSNIKQTNNYKNIASEFNSYKDIKSEVTEDSVVLFWKA